MEVVLIIAGSVVIMVVTLGLFQFLGERAKGAGTSALEARIAALELRLAQLEQSGLEREDAVRKLEGELSFLTNLLESRSRSAPAAGAPVERS